MKNKYLVAFVAAAIPGLAAGQAATSYQCSYGELQRRVEILTEPGVSVPCEVHYYKDTEAPGERQVLWSATGEEGYCERKTEEFIVKLQGWGWSCSAGGAEPAPEAAPEPEVAPEAEPEEATEPAPEPTEVDETDDLIPAEASVSRA